MRYAACLALFLAAPPAAAQLTPAEQAIADIVDQEAGRNIALLERLVNQNSGTLNHAGVEAAGKILGEELAALGFAIEWLDKRDTGRAGHLIATHRGNGAGKRILLIGHLDTVFEPSSPFQRFERAGGRATGPGVADMKGGLVVIVAALRAMHAAGTLASADIVVLATGDEELPGTPVSLARRELIEAGRAADVALEFETLVQDGGREYATVARRSSTSWTLTARGRSGHSSAIFSGGLGYGAIYEMARIIDAFRRELPEADLTYNVGVIGGGTPAVIDARGLRIEAEGKTNVVADIAIARGDLRTLTAAQDARVRQRMQQIVAQSLPHTSAELVFSDDGYPPMAPTDGNRALFDALNDASRDLGLPELAELEPSRRGAADSSFVAPYVDTLAGLGAAGGKAHAEGEWVELASLARQAKRIAVMLGRLARQQR